ncbi:MAG: oxidoreductase [Herpetosiphonaceae bacterium]|nr:MAG: oxidoreductase [Herpetosiphonaceae bacterium]
MSEQPASPAAHTSVGVAVLGCGHWGKNLVRNFAQLQALRWICDRHEPSLQAQAKLYPNIRATSNLADVLADSDVQAVVIATPAAMHYDHARQALLAGKDVFVEKPLALKYHQGQELVELARSRGAVLMVGHILEYHPAVTLLKDLIRRGELGRLLYVYSNRLNLGKVRQEENILWSFAPHDISVISTLVGSAPIQVSTSGGSYLQSNIVDVTVTNLLFEDGIRGHIFVSWLHPYKEQKLVVVGDRKMAVFDDTIREGKLKIYDKGIEWRAGLPMPRQTAETTLYLEEAEPMRLECEHFLACVRERKQPLTDGENALRVLKVLEAGQLSLERGGVPVPLTEIETGVPA